MPKTKIETPAPTPAKVKHPKKCQRKFHGVPGANTKTKKPRLYDQTIMVTNQDKTRVTTFTKKSTRTRLMMRPAHEYGRSMRLMRKLGLVIAPVSTRP